MKHIYWLVIIAAALGSAPLIMNMKHQNPHIIIVIDGTSSSGKSTVIHHLKQLLDDTWSTISMDDLMYDNRISTEKGDVDITKFTDMFYPKIKKLAERKNVIVDMMFGLNGQTNDGSYEKFFEVLRDHRIISVLVYCPIDVIIQRVKTRNETKNIDEVRDAMSPLVQFPAIYKIQSAKNEPIIDSYTQEQIKEAIKSAMYYDSNIAIKKNKLSKKHFEEAWPQVISPGGAIDQFFQEKFVNQLGWQPAQEPEARIASRHHYDLVVNSGANSAEHNAQNIVEYLNQCKC